MALLNSLFAGVSGLRNHQSMMDVIGNNIANVNTIGFKGSRVTFSDTFNQFVKAGTNPEENKGGSNSFQVGMGMKINSIDRNWNQGTFERTGITTDLALQGPGMFMLKSNGQTYYSRAGAFIFDADGKLVNPQNGAIVQGKVANGLGEIPPGNSVQDIIIDKNLRLPAVATENVSWGGNLESSSPTKRTDIVEVNGNVKLDDNTAHNNEYSEDFTIYGVDGQKYTLTIDYNNTAAAGGSDADYTLNYSISGGSLAAPVTGSQALGFDAVTGKCNTAALAITGDSGNLDFSLDLNSLRGTTSPTSVSAKIDKGEEPATITGTVTVYDSLGDAHAITMKYTHLDKNEWKWEIMDPSTGTIASASPNEPYGTIKFKTDGTIETIKQGTNTVSTLPAITFVPGNGADTQTISLDFGSGTAGITQTSLGSQVSALSQDGSASATLSKLNIDKYGNVVGIFSNGKSRSLAQIMVATFKNLNGLVSEGDNMFSVAANAGDPRIAEPGDSSVTTIQSQALEVSNVDLSEEFTKMIVSQRGFQANARVITTADNLLQEITNLIR